MTFKHHQKFKEFKESSPISCQDTQNSKGDPIQRYWDLSHSSTRLREVWEIEKPHPEFRQTQKSSLWAIPVHQTNFLTSLTLSCIHYRALYLGPLRRDLQLSICVFLEFFQITSLKGLRTSSPQSKIIYWDFHVMHKIHMAPQKSHKLYSSKLSHINSYWSAGCPQNSPRICVRTSDWT